MTNEDAIKRLEEMRASLALAIDVLRNESPREHTAQAEADPKPKRRTATPPPNTNRGRFVAGSNTEKLYLYMKDHPGERFDRFMLMERLGLDETAASSALYRLYNTGAIKRVMPSVYIYTPEERPLDEESRAEGPDSREIGWTSGT